MNIKDSKIPANQKQVCATISKTDNGSEIKIIARPSFFSEDKDGKPYCNMEPNEINGIKQKPGDTVEILNKMRLNDLLGKRIINKETYEALNQMLDDHNEFATQLQNHNFEDYHRKWTENALSRMKAMRLLLAACESSSEGVGQERELKSNEFDPTLYIGVTQILMDRLFYLPELIDKAKLFCPKPGTDTYRVISSINTPSMGEVGLEYTLKMSKKDKMPKEAFRTYLKEMQGATLKVFLAYWASACSQNRFSPPLTPLIDIMKPTLSEDRESGISNQEKRRFWEHSKLLEDTKLTLTLKIGQDQITHKQQLLSLPTTSSKTINKQQEDIRGYPDKVRFRVLDPDVFKERAYHLTAISRGTINLPEEDIMLATAIQTRARQVNKKSTLSYDRKFLMKRGNLSKTEKSNPRQATRSLKKKLQRLKEANVMEDFTQEKNKVVLKKKKK